MARIILVFFIAIVSLLVYLIYLKSSPPLPNLDLEKWWGPEELKGKHDTSIRPFSIKFTNDMVKDLRRRLKNYRPSAPPLEGVGFEYGFNSDQITGWLRYWAEEYHFGEREKYLNKYPQYKTNIQGLDVHFIRVKADVPPGVELVPLLLLHGWPGSVREFYEAIPRLTAVNASRDFSVEVIAPSLIGFGFSDAAVRPGMGTAQMAIVIRNLMWRLGFKKYYVQGGDWGSIIGGHLATIFPDDVLGYHTNMPVTSGPMSVLLPILGSIYPPLLFSTQEASRIFPLMDYYKMLMEELGYLHLHATKPDTIGKALSDSPAGLLVYLLQIFSTWTKREHASRPDGGLGLYFTKDQLLDNVMMYWTPNSINTAIRLYAETFSKEHMSTRLDEIPSHIPTWLLHSKYELLYQAPVVTRLKYPNILNVTVLDRGGHFIALELPEEFSDDVLKSIEEFRRWHSMRSAKLEL